MNESSLILLLFVMSEFYLDPNQDHYILFHYNFFIDPSLNATNHYFPGLYKILIYHLILLTHIPLKSYIFRYS